MPQDALNVREPLPEYAAPAPPERVVVSNVTLADDAPTTTSISASRPGAEGGRQEPVFFRIGAGYGTLGQLDLDHCRDRGLDPGYVHMHVTFRGAGSVARATVESPTPPRADALACISEALEAAGVPAFEGGDVTLSKSLYVSSDGRGPAFIVEGEDAPPRGGASRLMLAP